MAIKMCEVHLDGASWKFNTLSATKGLPAFTKFMHIVGEPLAQVQGLLDGIDTEIDDNSMSKGIGLLTQRAADSDLLALIQTMLQGLLKNDSPVQFDNEFAANYGLLFKLFLYSAKENFGSFLTGLSTLGDIGGLDLA